ncbi:hypothetical protein HanXRQr2_Chr08g0337271 [Helianthus annuus]|uniref:Transposase (putative) gypsy type domain-containing protein n=1 Tax=Helianthus annuus TaxID=4232 RepID=A0A9K3IE18_HELAN|nr:hypothetical protein HanXRQr2_Chr08g0337271 [Helianthus annuus]KAJ0722311.1 hypothetical protein HanOQP8_Chr08g0285201 [Helianthus annuus]
MSTKEHLEDSSEEMSASLPLLKWLREIFYDLVKNFKFLDSWDVRYPEEGQTAADAPAGYITLFWDYFADGNFRLPATRFVLDVLDHYNFHISQLHPIVRIRHFEFLCWSMHIVPTINRFRVFYQLHCSQGFYSFAQRSSTKKNLLTPPKSFHDWKPKFFFIKAGVIPMKMAFRGTEDIVVENMKTPESEIWEKGKMTTILKGAGEELWFQQIIRNFAFPRDEDLAAQPLTGAVEVEAVAQPAKKVPRRKISKRSNLDAFVSKLSPEKPIPSACTESSSFFNDDLSPSLPRASIREQLESTKAFEMEVEKIVEVKKPKDEAEKPEVELEAEKVVEVEAVDVGVTKHKYPVVEVHGPEKGTSIEDPMVTISMSTTTSAPPHGDAEKSPVGEQGFIYYEEEDSPIRPEETPGDYYYRSYSERIASKIHAPVWKLKQGDSFSDWQVYRDWLQGVFPPAEVKFQKERSHDQTYHAYLEETASSTSTTHRIVREWRSMHKE